MFIEQQISILEWFLKDHLTLKIGVMADKHVHHLKKSLKNKLEQFKLLTLKNLHHYWQIESTAFISQRLADTHRIAFLNFLMFSPLSLLVNPIIPCVSQLQ